MVKGMVQVSGMTYRIERLKATLYQAVRIADDAPVGTFQSSPKLEVISSRVEQDLMYQIARAALLTAKTSWIGRLSM
jgi:hypothetical protein